MPATRRRPARKTGRALPPITLAKLEETGHLLQRLVETNQTLFIDEGENYRAAHRAASSRALSADEAAQLAVTIEAARGEQRDAVQLAEQLQNSDLRAYDEPETREVLLAAGKAVAPAFLAAARDVVALVEMPTAEFEEACAQGDLEAAIERRSLELRKLPLDEARARASTALAHYSKAAGLSVGEAIRLLAQTVWQAIQQATSHLDGVSRPSSLIGSAEPTADSPPTTSSTDSLGGGQSS